MAKRSEAPVKIIEAQRAWFTEFACFTGGDANGLEDFEAGLSSFAEAAQHSLACFRQESHDMANRLEQALTTDRIAKFLWTKQRPLRPT